MTTTPSKRLNNRHRDNIARRSRADRDILHRGLTDRPLHLQEATEQVIPRLGHTEHHRLPLEPTVPVHLHQEHTVLLRRNMIPRHRQQKRRVPLHRLRKRRVGSADSGSNGDGCFEVLSNHMIRGSQWQTNHLNLRNRTVLII